MGPGRGSVVGRERPGGQSGCGQRMLGAALAPGSPASLAAAPTPAAMSSLGAHSPPTPSPSATMQAPVSVAMSTIASAGQRKMRMSHHLTRSRQAGRPHELAEGCSAACAQQEATSPLTPQPLPTTTALAPALHHRSAADDLTHPRRTASAHIAARRPASGAPPRLCCLSRPSCRCWPQAHPQGAAPAHPPCFRRRR